MADDEITTTIDAANPFLQSNSGQTQSCRFPGPPTPQPATYLSLQKTSVAIPTTCALVRDALVQATLDPAVRAIEFRAQARVDATQIDLNAIVIVRDDGRFYLDVVPARPVARVRA